MEQIAYAWLVLLALWCVWQVLRLLVNGLAAIGQALAATAARRAHTRAQTQAEQEQGGQKKQQKRREDARAGVEILYQLHQHELGERFPRATLDDFVQRYMGDSFEAEYVEARAQQLRELIQEHVRRLQPADPNSRAQLAQARSEVEALYDEHPEIHAFFPPRRFRAELRVRIPDTATVQEAWTQARNLMHEMLGLVPEEPPVPRPPPPPPFNPPPRNP